MPKPIRQSQTGTPNGRKTTPAPTRTSRSSGAPAESDNYERSTGLKLLVYGIGKTGKTRTADTFPKPLLIMGSEDGTKSIKTDRRQKAQLPDGTPVWELLIGKEPTGTDYVRLTGTEQVEMCANYMIDEGYLSGCLDHASGLQGLVIKEVLGLDDVPIDKDWGMAEQRQWGIISAQTNEQCQRLLRLSESHGINMVVIAHERSFGDEGSSDLMLPSIGAALTPTSARWLNGACDYIGQTFIREEVVKKEVLGKAAPGKKPTKTMMNVKTGRKQYCLRIGPHPVYMTGFRLPPGYTLPDLIVDPSYAKIMAIIRGETEVGG